VTAAFPGRCFAFDQFGPLSIRPCHGSCWAARRRPARLRATYHRAHGIRYFHGCYSLADDLLWGITRLRKGGDHTLAALKSIRAARPDGAPIYVILDNLSANKTPSIRTWAAKHKVRLCFTPASASWANPIEAQFGPLRTFVMGGSDHPSHAVLARRLQAYLAWRNANARRPGRPAPRTRTHPQRTPATLGPAAIQSRLIRTSQRPWTPHERSWTPRWPSHAAGRLQGWSKPSARPSPARRRRRPAVAERYG
jgi:hypothetical protein